MLVQKNLLETKNKIKKSHILLIGSLLIFLGIISLFSNYLLKMKDEVYSDMKIAMSNLDIDNNSNNVITEIPITENVISDDSSVPIEEVEIDYSKYLGVLEIPRIGLKRGFYNVGSKYNNIQYNVTLIEGSSLPDVVNGNLILMAHSGDAYISYFAFLYKLNVGDSVYVTYNGYRYQYQIVNIYDVVKNGVVILQRNHDRTTLTMITCTKNNDNAQTVYVAEMVG